MTISFGWQKDIAYADAMKDLRTSLDDTLTNSTKLHMEKDDDGEYTLCGRDG